MRSNSKPGCYSIRGGRRARTRRSVDIYHGDFNTEIDRILSAGSIKPKEAAFCLLDQHTFECHWKSLERLAAYKPTGKHKIELFYFLPIGWLGRALAATKDEALIRAWWGRSDWHILVGGELVRTRG